MGYEKYRELVLANQKKMGLGAEFLQFIPIVERVTPKTRAVADGGWGDRPKGRPQDGAQVTARSVGPAQWGHFLTAIFDDWVQHDVGRVYIQMFESALAARCGMAPSMCVFAETFGKALALEHNGDLYCCDNFVEPAYRLGNITETPMQELVASERQRAFGEAKRETLPAVCRACSVRFACNGECPRNRFMRAPDGEPGLNYLCAGYKAFFTHIAPPEADHGGLARSRAKPRGGDAPALPKSQPLKVTLILKKISSEKSVLLGASPEEDRE